MSLNTTSQTQEAITALDTLVKQNGALLERVLAFDGEVADAYDYLESKGAIMPEDKNIENLPATIEQIVDAHIGVKLTSCKPLNAEDNTVVDLSNIIFTGTSITGLCASYPYMKSFKAFGGTPNITNMSSMLQNCPSLETVDVRSLDTGKVTDMLTLFSGASILRSIDISTWDTRLLQNARYLFGNCYQLKIVDMRGFDMSSISNNAYSEGIFMGCGVLQSIIGGKTYEEVILENISTFIGLNADARSTYISVTQLDQASLRAIINGLADRTGQSALTLTIGATLLAKLSAEDIAVATNKNWTIA